MVHVPDGKHRNLDGLCCNSYFIVISLQVQLR
jgi:hypothetical protein